MGFLLEIAIDAAIHALADWIPAWLYRKGPKATKRGFLLRFPAVLRGFAILLWFTVSFVLTTLLLPPFDPRSIDMQIALVAVVLMLWPSGWLLATFHPSFLVTPREIVQLFPRGRRRRIRFDQITMVTSGYRIYGYTGTTLVVRRGILGYNDLARILLKRVPEERLVCIEQLEADAISRPGL